MEKAYRNLVFYSAMVFMACSGLQAQTPQFTWAGHAYGFGLEATSIGADKAGNCYTVGLLQGDATFGDHTFMGSSGLGHEMYIAKYDATGKVVWAFAPAFNQFAIEARNIVVDASGNSYITGYFRGATTLGSVVLSTNNSMFGGPMQMFVAKYNAAGALLWAEKAGAPGINIGTNDCVGVDIGLDANGNCSVLGNFTGTVTFGSTSLTSEGSTSLFIANYDANGNLKWAKKITTGNFGNVYDFSRGIGVDPAGNISITGNFGGNVSFGSNTLSSAGGQDIFIARYDGLGNSIWARRAGGSAADVGRDIAIDAAGNSYLTGSFSGSAAFGNNTLISNGFNDFFIAKYDVLGNVLWAKKGGGSSYDYGTNLALDEGGNVYLTGKFNGSAIFESAAITGSGGANFFIVKYDPAGNLLWIKQASGNYSCSGTEMAIALDAAGNSFLTGTFGGTPTFTNTSLSSTLNAGWNQNIFVAQLPNASPSQPLPVSWLYFTGKASEKTNHLNWATATEKNSSRFLIERSADGRSFETIGEVKAAGNSNQQLSYTFSDKNATVSGLKTAYYRLKQIDLDGGYDYSQIVTVSRKAVYSTIAAYPNPFSDKLTLAGFTEKPFGATTLLLTTLDGKIVTQQEIAADATMQDVTMQSLSNLPSGLYLLRVQQQDRAEVLKIMKQ